MEDINIVAIGASLGGVQAIPTLMSQLPADLPAAVFVILHVPPGDRLFPEILQGSGPLKTHLAKNGEPIQAGRVYAAPADRHMLIRPGEIEITRGPKENRTRPAVDPLFRSAAEAYGERVIGVLLTGMQSDGAAGLKAIQNAGGITIVQEPGDARCPEMPLSALAAITPDYCVPLLQIGPLIERLTRTNPAIRKQTVSRHTQMSSSINPDIEQYALDKDNGPLVSLSCPDCGGPLRQISERPAFFRCKVGHGFSEDSLLNTQSEEIERALWMAVRTLEERGSMLAKLAEDERFTGHHAGREFRERAEESKMHAARLRELLLRGFDSSRIETGG
jgi:two-component system, chemotaxis family, protein-glutamate methylesterase/glutaminase